jgi:hypothetical protein
MDKATLIAVHAQYARLRDLQVKTLGYSRLTFDVWLEQAIAEADTREAKILPLMALSFGCGVLVMLPALLWAML